MKYKEAGIFLRFPEAIYHDISRHKNSYIVSPRYKHLYIVLVRLANIIGFLYCVAVIAISRYIAILSPTLVRSSSTLRCSTESCEEMNDAEGDNAKGRVFILVGFEEYYGGPIHGAGSIIQKLFGVTPSRSIMARTRPPLFTIMRRRQTRATSSHSWELMAHVQFKC